MNRLFSALALLATLFEITNGKIHISTTQDPEFNPQKILGKSVAAGGLCSWVMNIHNFYNVFLVVEPKQKALLDTQNELKDAQDKLTYLNNKILVCEIFTFPLFFLSFSFS